MHTERMRKSDYDLDKRIKDQKEEKAKLRSKNKRVYLGRFLDGDDLEPNATDSQRQVVIQANKA